LGYQVPPAWLNAVRPEPRDKFFTRGGDWIPRYHDHRNRGIKLAKNYFDNITSALFGK